MSRIIEQVEDFYTIIDMDTFRKTDGVVFDMIPMELFEHIDSIDRVLHTRKAISPAPTGDNPRPWYMHPYQDDNLIVLQGTRFVEIYSPKYNKVESFKVTPTKVYKNDTLLFDGSALLIWPKNVFHRIISGDEGSASINIAVHYDGFNIHDNFNIYELNTETGDYHVLREGFKDQYLDQP